MCRWQLKAETLDASGSMWGTPGVEQGAHAHMQHFSAQEAETSPTVMQNTEQVTPTEGEHDEHVMGEQEEDSMEQTHHTMGADDVVKQHFALDQWLSELPAPHAHAGNNVAVDAQVAATSGPGFDGNVAMDLD